MRPRRLSVQVNPDGERVIVDNFADISTFLDESGPLTDSERRQAIDRFGIDRWRDYHRAMAELKSPRYKTMGRGRRRAVLRLFDSANT